MCLNDELIERGRARWGDQWPEVAAARQQACGDLQVADLEACLVHETGLEEGDGGVFQRYTGALLSLALRRVDDHREAEELVEDALLRTNARFRRARAGFSRHVIPRGPTSLPFLPFLRIVLDSTRADRWWAPALASRDARIQACEDAHQALRKATAHLDAFVMERILAFPLGASQAPGQRRLALFLARRNLYHEDVAALLGQTPSFMANLMRRQHDRLLELLEEDPAYCALQADVQRARLVFLEASQALRQVRADLRELRDGIRRLREQRRNPASTRAEIDRLQARIDELIRLLGMSDPAQLPPEYDPAAPPEEHEEDDDDPLDESED